MNNKIKIDKGSRFRMRWKIRIRGILSGLLIEIIIAVPVFFLLQKNLITTSVILFVLFLPSMIVGIIIVTRFKIPLLDTNKEELKIAR